MKKINFRQSWLFFAALLFLLSILSVWLYRMARFFAIRALPDSAKEKFFSCMGQGFNACDSVISSYIFDYDILTYDKLFLMILCALVWLVATKFFDLFRSCDRLTSFYVAFCLFVFLVLVQFFSVVAKVSVWEMIQSIWTDRKLSSLQEGCMAGGGLDCREIRNWLDIFSGMTLAANIGLVILLLGVSAVLGKCLVKILR